MADLRVREEGSMEAKRWEEKRCQRMEAFWIPASEMGEREKGQSEEGGEGRAESRGEGMGWENGVDWRGEGMG